MNRVKRGSFLEKSVAIIGTAGIPAKYGGFETLAENLVKNNSSNIKYTVFCSSKIYKDKLQEFYNAKLSYINLNANGTSSIFYDLLCLVRCSKYNVILVLGVSAALFFPIYKKIYRGKIICNIDGIEWKREKWNFLARKFLRISERFAVTYADHIIVDNNEILSYIFETYQKKGNLIEYGGDNAVLCDDKQLNNIALPKKYAICVCRIEPENNIHTILSAFHDNGSKNLIFIGNWQNSEYGRKLYKKYHKTKNLFLFNPIYDQIKINTLRRKACLYVHGHSAGGTNPSLVEAMNLMKPVVAYDCKYNRSTMEGKGLYFKNAQELFQIIDQMDNYDLEGISKSLFAIASNRYTWQLIASKYESLFNNCFFE